MTASPRSFPPLDQRHPRGGIDELEIELAAEHLRQRGHRGLVGDTHRLQPCAGLVELGGGERRRAAIAIARLVSLQLHRLGQLRHVLPRRVGAHHQGEIALVKRRDRAEILDWVVRQLLEIEQVRGMRGGHRGDQDGVAVGRRFRHRVGAGGRDHARLVLDDHRPAADLRQLVRIEARDHVTAASSREADHHPHHPGGIILRLRGRTDSKKRRRDRSDRFSS